MHLDMCTQHIVFSCSLVNGEGGDWVIGEPYDDIQLSIYFLLLGIRNAFTVVAFSFLTNRVARCNWV